MKSHGKERRRRFVYVTRNTEYHVLDEICVGVRDRNSGRWDDRHAALRRRLEGGVRVFPNGAVVPMLAPPSVGQPLYFDLDDEEEGDQLVTSRVQSIDRPRLEDLGRYPTSKAG
jgi:hypothetical protein